MLPPGAGMGSFSLLIKEPKGRSVTRNHGAPSRTGMHCWESQGPLSWLLVSLIKEFKNRLNVSLGASLLEFKRKAARQASCPSQLPRERGRSRQWRQGQLHSCHVVGMGDFKGEAKDPRALGKLKHTWAQKERDRREGKPRDEPS